MRGSDEEFSGFPRQSFFHRDLPWWHVVVSTDVSHALLLFRDFPF